MSELDALLARELDAAFPAPAAPAADWENVLARASRPRRVRALASARIPRQRPLLGLRPPARLRPRLPLAFALAFAIPLSLTGLAAASALVGGQLGGAFTQWLGVGPGLRAPSAAQRSFATRNAGSIARFPRGTTLRLLLARTIAGTRYQLFGFTAGDAVCLSLSISHAQSPPSCAPLRELSPAAQQPVQVLVAGERIGRRADAVTVSYGLTTDAIRRVELLSAAGRGSAVLAHDAFLRVGGADSTPLGAIAVQASGDEVPIALARRTPPTAASEGWRFQRTPRLRESVLAPARASQRTLPWLLRRRAVGEPLLASALAASLPPAARVLYARVLAPDSRISHPATPDERALRVGVALVRIAGVTKVCELLFQPLDSRLAGCAPARSLFARDRVVGRILTVVPRGQQAVLVGLAAPSVRKVSYLTSGVSQFVSANVAHGVFAIPLPRFSSPLWLSVATRTAHGQLDSEAEFGRW